MTMSVKRNDLSQEGHDRTFPASLAGGHPASLLPLAADCSIYSLSVDPPDNVLRFGERTKGKKVRVEAGNRMRPAQRLILFVYMPVFQG
jgi:hypothetical protein